MSASSPPAYSAGRLGLARRDENDCCKRGTSNLDEARSPSRKIRITRAACPYGGHDAPPLGVRAGRPWETVIVERPVQVGHEQHGRLGDEKPVDASVRKRHPVRLTSTDILLVVLSGASGRTNRVPGWPSFHSLHPSDQLRTTPASGVRPTSHTSPTSRTQGSSVIGTASNCSRSRLACSAAPPWPV